jgi:hypothetical protein
VLRVKTIPAGADAFLAAHGGFVLQACKHSGMALLRMQVHMLPGSYMFDVTLKQVLSQQSQLPQHCLFLFSTVQ